MVVCERFTRRTHAARTLHELHDWFTPDVLVSYMREVEWDVHVSLAHSFALDLRGSSTEICGTHVIYTVRHWLVREAPLKRCRRVKAATVWG